MVCRSSLVCVSLLLLLLGLANAWPRPQEEEYLDEPEVEDSGAGDEEDDDAEQTEDSDAENNVDADADLNDIDFWNLGLLKPTGNLLFDEDSQEFFNPPKGSDYGGGEEIPSTFSAVDMGWVTPVKSQRQCGSCAAFAAMAVLEVCFARVTNQTWSYSEQQLIDCAYGYEGAGGCDGASPSAYLKWAHEKFNLLAREEDYPYDEPKNASRPKDHCKEYDTTFPFKARVVASHYTISGDELILRDMVVKYGAATASILYTNQTLDRLRAYEGGIFDGCTDEDLTDGQRGHAMAAVGYGRENGQDYWLLKNSWGQHSGEKGYMKFIRGKGACSIGKGIATVECEVVNQHTCPDHQCMVMK